MMKSRALQLMLIAMLFIHMPEMTRAQGLEQQTKAQIEFGAGSYTTDEIVYIQGNRNRTDSDAQFKGKGITGGLIGKFFKSGKRTTLVDLDEGMTREIDPKKKKCVMQNITNVADTLKSAMNSLKDARESWEQERGKYDDMSKSEFEIIESVFEVKDLGDSKKVNDFQCSHYGINAYTVRRHVSNEATMVDSMYIDTWVTPLTDELKQAKEIQQAFAMAFAEKMGLSETFDEMRESFLGGKWLQMFRMTGGGQLASDRNYENMPTEMQKLENKHPIKTSGRFYFRVITPAKTTEASADVAASSDEIKSTGDIQDQAAEGISGLAKGLFGKKKKEEPGIKPIFSFETENKSVKIANIDQGKFTSEYECKTEN